MATLIKTTNDEELLREAFLSKCIILERYATKVYYLFSLKDRFIVVPKPHQGSEVRNLTHGINTVKGNRQNGWET